MSAAYNPAPAGATLRIGSLFSGYEGLGQGFARVFRSILAWVCDNDKAASRVLAHHWPDVPNLGDITKVDWDAVPEVDVVVGGPPCQGVSTAGKRLGLLDERSGLWTHMAYAIGRLRPRLVLIENVRGLASAAADSNVEPCPWCLGDGQDQLHMRALGAFLADLADIGYDTEWICIPASDAGAPHGRARFFILAWPADVDGTGPGLDLLAALRGDAAADSEDVGHERLGSAWDRGPGSAHGGGRPAPDPDEAGLSHGLPGGPGLTQPTGGGAAERRGGPAPDAGGERHGRGEDAGRLGRLDSEDEGGPSQRQRARRVACDRGQAAPDSGGDGCARGEEQHSGPAAGLDGPSGGDVAGRDVEPGGLDSGRPEPAGEQRGPDAALGGTAAWGPYGPAIARWERVLGRPAPAPTQPGKGGAPRLSARFTEWMMGMEDGHVTNSAIWEGVKPATARNLQLKLCGNGVVQQQAALALRILLTRAYQAYSTTLRNVS